MATHIKKLILTIILISALVFAAFLAQHVVDGIAEPLSPTEYYLSGLPKHTAIAPRSGQIPSGTHPIS